MHFYACQALTDVVAHRPEEFGGMTFLLKSIAYNATARADMFTLPCSNKVRLLNNFLLIFALGRHLRLGSVIPLTGICLT